MRSGGSKAKGSAFERLVCKRLSLWLSHGDRDDLFWRSAMSGGRATVQLRRDIVNKAQAGDLTAIDPAAYAFAEHLFIEVKHYGDLQIGRGLICQSGRFWDFWSKTMQEAARYDKVPLLIARQNRYPIIAVTRDTRAIFSAPPKIILPGWQAELCLFEEATRYKKLIRRRAA